MPFKSQAQRTKFLMMAKRGEISNAEVKKWEKHTPHNHKLPYHVDHHHKNPHAHGMANVEEHGMNRAERELAPDSSPGERKEAREKSRREVTDQYMAHTDRINKELRAAAEASSGVQSKAAQVLLDSRAGKSRTDKDKEIIRNLQANVSSTAEYEKRVRDNSIDRAHRWEKKRAKWRG